MDDLSFKQEVFKKSLIEKMCGAVISFKKKSKLRSHFLNLVDMNNIIRAYLYHYHLSDEIKQTQTNLLKALCSVEARKNRIPLPSEIKAIEDGFSVFETLIVSSENNEIDDIINFTNKYANESKFVVTSKKN